MPPSPDPRAQLEEAHEGSSLRGDKVDDREAVYDGAHNLLSARARRPRAHADHFHPSTSPSCILHFCVFCAFCGQPVLLLLTTHTQMKIWPQKAHNSQKAHREATRAELDDTSLIRSHSARTSLRFFTSVSLVPLVANRLRIRGTVYLIRWTC